MGHYKATMIDSNVPVVTSYNLLGLQKKISSFYIH